MKGSSNFEFPPDLEVYLPPSLWRKLSSGEPQRILLVQALDRLRSILYLLSTFLPGHLVQEKMKRAVPGLVSGKTLKGSLLFADVSGFTALSERLAVLGLEGAERLTEIMNNYFEAMLEILSWSGGNLLKFAGDATLVYFPEQRMGRQAQWAVRAGMRMLRAVSAFSNIETPTETVNLKMKIGVATGEFLSASIGSDKRMEYAVLGNAVSQTMDAEGAATGPGQLIVNAATVDCLGDLFSVEEQAPGFYRLEQSEERELSNFEIRAEKRRARGAVPMEANTQTIFAQMESTLDQIRALQPYLAPELVERIIVHAKERRFESEFRLTVVLFCNFIGPERLIEIWGNRGMGRITNLLSAYFTAMSEVIARYGGIVSRIDPYSKGTKLLALFGAPVSHQDDPLRAVRAASLMNVELRNLNDSWSQKLARHLPDDFEGPLIQHRIGITKGETFAGQVGSSTRREYTVMGDDVNLSARLMGASKPGQILISQPVYDFVDDFFFLTTLIPIKVKGKTKPIPIYQVDGPRSDTLLNRVRQRGRLIGREQELTFGQDLLRKALSGTCNALTIQGAAGSGKSHLADMLLKEALSSGARVLSYRCNSYNANIPYSGLGGLLRSLAGITSTDPKVLHWEKMNQLISDLDLPENVGISLGTLMGLDFSDQPRASQLLQDDEKDLFEDVASKKGMRRRNRSSDLLAQLEVKASSGTSQTGFYSAAKLTDADQDLMLQAVSNLLTAELAKSPLVIFFEDAHWLDLASRELLSALHQSLDTQPLIIMLAQRGDEEQATMGETLKLEPLNLAGTNELVADILLSDLTQLIHQQSNGNPLFIAEITRWVRQTWNISLTDIKKALQTSDFLRNLVFSNLENLPENQREIVRIGSVIGDEFRVGELQALLSSSMDPVSLHSDLRSLVAARFISLTEAGVDSLYSFQQKLVRDILYNSLPFARRRELHAKLATHLSAPPSQRSKIHARISLFLDDSTSNKPAQQDTAIIAHHYEAAEKWLPAAQNFLQAARNAREHKLYAEADDYYRRALDGLEKLSPEKTNPEIVSLRRTLLGGQGDIAFLGDNYAQAGIAYQAALDVHPEGTNSAELTDLKVKLALVLIIQGRVSEAERTLRQILDNDKTKDLAAMTALAWLLWRTGKSEAGEWIDKCQSLLPATSNDWTVGIEIMLNDFSGNWEAVISAYQTINQPVGAALASVRLGDRHLGNGDLTKAQTSYQTAARILEKVLDDSCGLSLAHYRLAEVYWQMQDIDAAREDLAVVQKLLSSCPGTIRKEAQTLIVKGFEIINTEAPGSWPEWRWQVYDDTFRIKLLFRP